MLMVGFLAVKSGIPAGVRKGILYCAEKVKKESTLSLKAWQQAVCVVCEIHSLHPHSRAGARSHERGERIREQGLAPTGNGLSLE
jgi:hypothetical protein